MDLALFATYLVACGAAATTGAMFSPGPWYDALKMPDWTPPNWLFPVAWMTLYLLMSAAAGTVGVGVCACATAGRTTTNDIASVKTLVTCRIKTPFRAPPQPCSEPPGRKVLCTKKGL